jgi:AcrR family transcriptional regulator
VDTPEKDAMSRKEREKERHRLEILDAAERVFARDGFYGTTVESIAKEAEFAVGTIYNFFESKEDLYEKVLFRIMAGFMEDLDREVMGQSDVVEAIGALFDVRVRHTRMHRDFFRLIMASGPRAQEGLHAKMMESFDAYVKKLAGLVERGMAQGVLRKQDDPLFAALCLESICHAMMIYYTRYKPDAPLEELAQRAKQAVLAEMQA